MNAAQLLVIIFYIYFEASRKVKTVLSHFPNDILSR